LKDFDGEFTRAYSVVESIWDTIKLWIKLQDTGRWGRTLKKLKIWDALKIKGVYGNFVLKTTSNPKVFVATGTGFSPIYNMISHNTFSQNNMLFWWVATKEDLYYVNQLNNYPHLQVQYFLSQEDITWCNYGRVDATTIDFPLNTEFYLCGNPAMVTGQMKLLKDKWYQYVYAEIF
jgi:NAD(P)H-flavin reductase